jgi:hypothetical protein
LSAEGGLLSLKALRDEEGKPYNFDYVEVDKFEVIDNARQQLRFGRHDYDTVIIDSITEIQQICMDKILRDEKREKALIQDWGTLAQRMVTAIRDFRDMNLNLIVTALSGSEKDEDTGGIRTIPLVQGKLKDSLSGYFDEVFYLDARSTKDKDGKEITKRALRTQGNQQVVAKDRSGRLPLYVEPDFCKLYAAIFE